MLPWGHLAVGYLLYTGVVRLWHRRALTGMSALTVMVATQIPDLIDKPLNWAFDIFDGRALAHSLLVLTVLCGLCWYGLRARRVQRANELAAAFSIGVLSHPIGDAWGAITSGQPLQASFLFWPLLEPPTYPSDTVADHVERGVQESQTFLASPLELLGSSFGFQVVLFGVFLVVWALDGYPGLKTVRRTVARWLNIPN